MTTELKFLKKLPDSKIDATDPDAPDLSSKPGWVRGKFYRPLKKPICIRIDLDVLEWFKQHGQPYQALINQVLRKHVENQTARPRTRRA
jgi:uncharacterized protein (DUF4415 family)